MQNKADYFEATDLYLEMLYTAQKVEDQKLMAIIRRRLKDQAHKMMIPESGCEVIVFPLGMNTTLVMPEEKQLWPQKPFRHLMAIFISYCGFITLISLIGLG